MSSDLQQTPFVKQLAANDRPTREKALASLRTYLTSGHEFTELELLKIWKGLFFCMFHTASPIPQSHLSQTLSSLLLPLSPSIFLPFLQAFYTTMVSLYPQLPSLRLDKYLYLLRRYVSASFLYLSQHSWHSDLVDGYLDLLTGDVGPLSRGVGEQKKVPDGIRYHVLDVWVEELRSVVKENGNGEEKGEVMMEVVRVLAKDGLGKVLRKRAKECVKEWDDGLRSEEDKWGNESKVDALRGSLEEDEEWDGFGN